MTTIVRRRAMTVDALRERTQKVMATKKVTESCSHCDGSGTVEKTLTQQDVAAAIGISKVTLNIFLKKGSAMSLQNGLRLMAWLDEQERIPDPDKPYTADEPRSPAVRQESRDRLTAMRNAAARAGAEASIDGINRPLVVRG